MSLDIRYSFANNFWRTFIVYEMTASLINIIINLGYLDTQKYYVVREYNFIFKISI